MRKTSLHPEPTIRRSNRKRQNSKKGMNCSPNYEKEKTEGEQEKEGKDNWLARSEGKTNRLLHQPGVNKHSNWFMIHILILWIKPSKRNIRVLPVESRFEDISLITAPSPIQSQFAEREVEWTIFQLQQQHQTTTSQNQTLTSD